MSSRQRRVLLVAHDRGGVNQLVPLLSAWRSPDSGIHAEFLGTPMIEWEVAGMMGERSFPDAAAGIHRKGASPTPAQDDKTIAGIGGSTFSEEHLRRVLLQPWDLVLTGTSMVSRLETSVWRLCAQLGIPFAAICDMWSEYSRRVTDEQGRVPLSLFLMLDERMENEARAELGVGIRLKTVGSPHFNRLMLSRGEKQKAPTSVRFISEPVAAFFPAVGLHEFAVAEMLIEARDRVAKDATVILRPHPQDDSEAWRRFVYDYRNRNVRLDDEPSWRCYSSTSMGMGMSSMMLIELAIAGVPVASFQPPFADRAFFCLNEEEFGIQIVSNPDGFDNWLQAPRAPRISDAFARRHLGAIDHLTALVRDGILFD